MRLTKTTPDFPEHLVLTYITRLEQKEDHLVLNLFLNNVRVLTRFYDCLPDNGLPSSSAHAPVVSGARSRPVQVVHRRLDWPGVLLQDEHQAGPGYRWGAVSNGGGLLVPTTIDKAFANTQRWFMIILVASQALLPGATFQLSPRAALAYLQTLHYVDTY